jgi:hypothetical protein
MSEPKNYFKIVDSLESDVCAEINQELARIGHGFKRDDEDDEEDYDDDEGNQTQELDFFNLDVVSDLKEITNNGKLIFDDGNGSTFTTSVKSMLENNNLNISDAITLLDELRGL